MSLASSTTQTVALAIPLLIAVVAISYFGTRLARRNHGPDIRIVWYLFSLSAAVTLAASWWAVRAGAISSDGSFNGTAGTFLSYLLKAMLDLEAGLMVYVGAVALVVGPQFASWLLSGLFGCASSPILVGAAFRFLFWSVVKSLVVAAGVLLTVSAIAAARGWGDFGAYKMLGTCVTAFILLATTFFLLSAYRDLQDDALAPDPGGSRTAKLGKTAARIGTWMNRRIHPRI